MRRKFLILGLVMAACVVLGWWFDAQTVRQQALAQLAAKLKFCQIVRDEIWFGRGRFWLICNGRPFYATYADGQISYELNGWSFLREDVNLWAELGRCEFYDLRDGELIFYCPSHFGERPTARYFSFEQFRLAKSEERDLREMLVSDIVKIYSMFEGCTLVNFTGRGGGRHSLPFVSMTLECEDGSYSLGTSLTLLLPPLLVSEEDDERRALISFERAFGKRPSVRGHVASSTLDGVNLTVSYPADYGFASVRLDGRPDDVVRALSKLLLFPPLSAKNVTFIKSLVLEPREGYPWGMELFLYRIDGKIAVVSVERNTDRILGFSRMWEGYHEMEM